MQGLAHLPVEGWSFSKMLSTPAGSAANEVRRSMFIVWLAISAVWLGFWALIATLAFSAADIELPLLRDFVSLFLLVVCPPAAIFGLVVAARVILALGRHLAGSAAPDCR
jgi:hypothetical protein